MSATAFQPEPSANAPCTKTTFLICSFMTILLLVVKIHSDRLIFDVERLRADCSYRRPSFRRALLGRHHVVPICLKSGDHLVKAPAVGPDPVAEHVNIG